MENVLRESFSLCPSFINIALWMIKHDGLIRDYIQQFTSDMFLAYFSAATHEAFSLVEANNM